jgi:hypothetical protein
MSTEPFQVPVELMPIDQASQRLAVEEEARAKLRKKLAAVRFDASNPPLAPVPRLLINGQDVCTPGNLTTIIAQTKAGKSAFVGAAIAAVIAADRRLEDQDTLGWSAGAPGGKVLLHFDTEQSPFDHFRCIERELQRVGGYPAPDWLRSYCCTGFSRSDLKAAVRLAVEDAVKAPGVFAMIIDGISDLVTSVNELEECAALVAEVRELSVIADCPVIAVIHDNEGSRAQGDGRGHLGKELMRKAESNLRLKKIGDVTVAFSEKMRRAPIPEKDGPRFRWCDERRMHVSEVLAPDPDLVRLARDVFEEGREVGANVAKRRIRDLQGCSDGTSKNRWREMVTQKIVLKSPGGKYSLA